MKRKKQEPKPPKPKEFHATPFSALKGVAVAAPPLPESVKAPPAPPVPPAEAEDADLFLQAMGGVTPLVGQGPAKSPDVVRKKPDRPALAIPKERGPIDRADKEAFAQAIKQLKLDVTFTDKLPDEELKPLGANRLRQLKKGIIRVDRQLDLHGLTREEALIALPRFLRNARHHGEKAVLVITGKGINSPEEPVLQQAIAAWLRDAGKEHVVEFAPAPREMGGSGAFVVFLRAPAP